MQSVTTRAFPCVLRRRGVARQFPRPGLDSFLQYCHQNFSRIVIFTTVKESLFRKIATTLVESKKVPDWFPDLEYIHWKGKYKDLSFIPKIEINRVVLVDDIEQYIKPEQKRNWLYIPGYNYPYSDDDSELLKIIDKLSQLG